MLASGIYYEDLSHECGIPIRTLRRHEALHSTVQTNVDPLTILRHMRWLMEEADKLAGEVLKNGKRINEETVKKRILVINTSLAVATEYAKLVNAKKALDPHVSLPRWQQVMRKIADALKDNPEGLKSLMAIMQEEGPIDAPIYFKIPQKPLGERALETILTSDEKPPTTPTTETEIMAPTEIRTEANAPPADISTELNNE